MDLFLVECLFCYLALKRPFFIIRMPILLFSLKKRSIFIIYLKKIDLFSVFLVSSIYPIYYLKKNYCLMQKAKRKQRTWLSYN